MTSSASNREHSRIPQDSVPICQECYNAKAVSIRRVHEELMILRVRPDQGPIRFQPGQYTVLGLGAWEPRVDGVPGERALRSHLVQRAYSISCPMLDEAQRLVTVSELPYLEFYVALVRRDSDNPPMLTPRLFGLKEGDRVYVGPHPHGHYVPNGIGRDDTLLYFATGTGEAPHNAHIAELLKRGHRGLILCATSARYRRDLAYLSVHQVLSERYVNYHYFPLTTREPENLDPSRDDYIGKTYLQDLIRRPDYRRQLGGRLDPLRTHAYLCGNPAMIGLPARNSRGELSLPEPHGMVETLMELGLRPDEPRRPGNIHFEKYW